MGPIGLVRVEATGETARVYNVHVDGLHNYHVGIDRVSLRVHNDCDPTDLAQHLRYKEELRAQMEMPTVADPDLKMWFNELWRPGAKVGNGSSMAAARVEVQNPGFKVGDSDHITKVKNYSTALANWLARAEANGASSRDVAAAENVLLDMYSALKGRP